MRWRGVLGSISGILLAGRTGAVDLQLASAFFAAVGGSGRYWWHVHFWWGGQLYRHNFGGVDSECAQFDAHFFECGAGDATGRVWHYCFGFGLGLCKFDEEKLTSVPCTVYGA